MDPEFLNPRPEQDLAAAMGEATIVDDGVFPVPAGLLDQLTPYHLVIDPWLRIVRAGRSMRTLVPEIAGYEIGEPLALPMLFDAQSPARPFSFESLVANQRTLVIWVLRHRGIRIRGEVAALRIGVRDYLFFNGSPWLSSTRELDHFGLRLRDFAAYDPVVEHLMLLDTHRLIETDLRDVNRNLQEQRRLLERSSREVQAYLAVLAHEVRTPIAGVIGALELLGRTPLNRHQQELRRSVQDASNSLLELLNHILDYSSIGSSGIDLRTYQTALAPFCENLLIAMGSAAQSARVDLFLVCPPDLPDVIVDPVRLRQILFNLLGNAIKYRREQTGIDSWVELRVAVNAVNASDGARAAATGIDVCFSVIDNGSGIDPAFMPILFEPFTREAPRGGGLRPPGTGLGLPICRELVQAMGGSITVESTQGIGSRFDVRVRLDRAP
ncbi:MAG: sensor histidine kinase, partial [Gammaproteobacteria bacterium]